MQLNQQGQTNPKQQQQPASQSNKIQVIESNKQTHPTKINEQKLNTEVSKVEQKQQNKQQHTQKGQEIKQHKEPVKKESSQKISTLQLQLLDMGFQQPLVKQALAITQDKDKAIEYIITCLQNQQKMQDKQKNSKKMMMQTNQKGVKPKQNQDVDDDDFEDYQQEHKMVFLVRMDLKMGLGKIAAQCAHATLKAYKQMVARANQNDLDFVALEEWKELGQKKIVVKVNDENELLNTLKKASQKGINTCYIRDAGLTQIASGSITVGALGPAPSSELDIYTKCFKLL